MARDARRARGADGRRQDHGRAAGGQALDRPSSTPTQLSSAHRAHGARDLRGTTAKAAFRRRESERARPSCWTRRPARSIAAGGGVVVAAREPRAPQAGRRVRGVARRRSCVPRLDARAKNSRPLLDGRSRRAGLRGSRRASRGTARSPTSRSTSARRSAQDRSRRTHLADVIVDVSARAGGWRPGRPVIDRAGRPRRAVLRRRSSAPARATGCVECCRPVEARRGRHPARDRRRRRPRRRAPGVHRSPTARARRRWRPSNRCAALGPVGPHPGRRRRRRRRWCRHRRRRVRRGRVPPRRRRSCTCRRRCSAGRCRDRRQDRREPARGQEPGRRVLAAGGRPVRHRGAGHAAAARAPQRHGARWRSTTSSPATT